MDTGYPRSIEDDFPGIGDEVDAAAYHYGNFLIVYGSPQTETLVIIYSFEFLISVEHKRQTNYNTKSQVFGDYKKKMKSH